MKKIKIINREGFIEKPSLKEARFFNLYTTKDTLSAVYWHKFSLLKNLSGKDIVTVWLNRPSEGKGTFWYEQI